MRKLAPPEHREVLPLTGLRLYRWRLALAIYSVGCWVSGRHPHMLVFDKDWKVWYCPHCGRSDDE